jgi:hypothetical protein
MVRQAGVQSPPAVTGVLTREQAGKWLILLTLSSPVNTVERFARSGGKSFPCG